MLSEWKRVNNLSDASDYFGYSELISNFDSIFIAPSVYSKQKSGFTLFAMLLTKTKLNV